MKGGQLIGVDLGGTIALGRACLRRVPESGRIEAWASAPGSPSLADQERDDQVAEGTYGELVRSGGLSVDVSRVVPSVERLLSRVWAWEPLAIVCDSYRTAELHKAVEGRTRVIERGRGGGESTSNVQASSVACYSTPNRGLYCGVPCFACRGMGANESDGRQFRHNESGETRPPAKSRRCSGGASIGRWRASKATGAGRVSGSGYLEVRGEVTWF